MKYNQLFTCCALLISSYVLQAQPAAVVYGGIAKLTNQAKLITPEGTAHPGFVIGADAMLSSTGLNLMGGLQYHQFHFIATENSSFFGMDDHISYVKLRFGMNAGFKVGSNSLLRFYGLAAAPLLTNLPTSERDVPQQSLRDTYFSAVGGAAFSLGPGVIFIEYQKGLSDVATTLAETRNTSFVLSLGLMF